MRDEMVFFHYHMYEINYLKKSIKIKMFSI